MNTQAKDAQLQAMFPAVTITIGYIGNCGAGFDDRSWRIFTDIPTTGVWGKQAFNAVIPGPDFDVAAVATQIARVLISTKKLPPHLTAEMLLEEAREYSAGHNCDLQTSIEDVLDEYYQGAAEAADAMRNGDWDYGRE